MGLRGLPCRGENLGISGGAGLPLLEKDELGEQNQIDPWVVRYFIEAMGKRQGNSRYNLTSRSKHERHRRGSRFHANFPKNMLEMFFYRR
jgi:hypothetical protein